MTTSSELVLVDTNILIYTHDPRAPRKRATALAIVGRLGRASRMALSVQCLTEFYRVSTQRVPYFLTPEAARLEVQALTEVTAIFPLTTHVVLEATRVAATNSVPIWDALIWAVAATNGIATVLTEDIRDTIEGVRFVNPFAPGFDIDAL